MADSQLYAEGLKSKAFSCWISSCLREMDLRPTSAVFCTILGINLLLWLCCYHRTGLEVRNVCSYPLVEERFSIPLGHETKPLKNGHPISFYEGVHRNKQTSTYHHEKLHCKYLTMTAIQLKFVKKL